MSEREGEFKKRLGEVWRDTSHMFNYMVVAKIVEDAKKEFPKWRDYISMKESLLVYQSDCNLWFMKWFGSEEVT